ncbi:ABC transporter substrate-binding protein [Castellaniella sp.]|uniref:ABC transporter substrate-binding protein n=1 Tax=Castellaniella sp. TaxID=1955812 RepID=UPI002AFF064C|nr:ABC transporter substrate-binding protein [Castellaniella sp.]
MMTRKLLISGAIALTAWSAGASADITIGALFPMSGPNAVYNDIFGSGSNLAVKHINEDKFLDQPLAIQYEDSQALPQQGVIGMNKLVNVHRVSYVMSAFTGVSKAISTIGARTKTVAINGGGVGPDLAELGPYFWNIIPLANYEVKAILPYLIQERGAKRFVLVYVDDPLGAAIKKEMQEGLGQEGTALVDAFSVPASAQQFSGIAARVRAARPDVVYIASYGTQQAQIIKQFRDNGVTQQLASYSALSIPEIHSMPEAKGTLYTSQSIDWQSNDPVTRRFVDDYKAAHNKLPSTYTANYYNAVRLFGLLAGELQKRGKSITGENLLAQRMETREFDMVGGSVTFNENGTVISAMQINEVDGNGGRVVKVLAE